MGKHDKYRQMVGLLTVHCIRGGQVVEMVGGSGGGMEG